MRERPAEGARLIGGLRAGSVVTRGEAPVGRAGCAGGWYAVGDGYVCVEPSSATLDTQHPLARLLARGPDRGRGLPYAYGIVRKQGPLYSRLPTRKEAEREEGDLDARMREWLDAPGELGALFRPEIWSRDPRTARALWDAQTTDVPPVFAGDKAFPGNLSGLTKDPGALVVGRTKRHNGLALVDTAVVDGRRYGITTNLLVVPIDRLRPIEGSQYHGVEIPRDIDFPFALIRRAGGASFREEGKQLVKVADLPRRAAIKLTGKQKFFHKVLHFQTEDGLWISDQVASRLDPAKKMPRWGKKGERWLDVNVTKQTLVAYDGARAVYATLVSTGEAGLGDPEKSKSTKRGIFRVHTKHVAATMDSETVGEEFELRDIPYVQYFEGGYALHAAYWHDDFGTPRSHGCINLAPEDARYLFDFTEPKVPEGFHTARRALTGSVVFVHP